MYIHVYIQCTCMYLQVQYCSDARYSYVHVYVYTCINKFECGDKHNVQAKHTYTLRQTHVHVHVYRYTQVIGFTVESPVCCRRRRHENR